MKPVHGNGKPDKANAKANGAVVAKQPNGKMIGGITGKGFLPGKSGNPSGLNIGRRKEAFAFGNYLRDWLQEQPWAKDENGKRIAGEVRLKTIVERLAEQKPEVLLHYAYGKPVEVHEVAAAEGTEIEFVVRVKGQDMP